MMSNVSTKCMQTHWIDDWCDETLVYNVFRAFSANLQEANIDFQSLTRCEEGDGRLSVVHLLIERYIEFVRTTARREE